MDTKLSLAERYFAHTPLVWKKIGLALKGIAVLAGLILPHVGVDPLISAGAAGAAAIGSVFCNLPVDASATDAAEALINLEESRAPIGDPPK